MYSTEAEYRACGVTTKELLWTKSFLSELHIKDGNIKPLIHCDNQSAITNITSNKPFSEKLKHAAIQFHFIRQHIQNNNIQVKYVASEDNLADILTKPLKPDAFIHLRDQLVYPCN